MFITLLQGTTPPAVRQTLR